MFRRKRDGLKEKAFRASEVALQLAQDKRFREHVHSSVEHGTAVWHQTRRGRGLVGAARRLASDQELQTELRKGRDDLQKASERLNTKKRGRRLRRIAQLAGLASLAAVPQVRERVSALIATASKKRAELQNHTSSNGQATGKQRPRALDDLTKEELYARAQEAEIAGRSEMSKDELVAALRARAGS
jgi:hypothetical protein